MTDAAPGPAETPAGAAATAPAANEPAVEAPATTAPPVSDAAATPAAEQTSLAAPPPAPRGLSYAVDIVFCIDVTGSMTPILDQV
jgi:hypothetical protein